MYKKTLFITVFLISSVVSAFAAEPIVPKKPIDYRTWTTGQSLWLWDHEQLFLYRTDSKALKAIKFSDSIAHDQAIDIAENGGVLWAAATSGLYQIDMTTSTIEHIPNGPGSFEGAKVAADADFAWVAQHDTLWKFDKLSREWLPFAFGKQAQPGTPLVGAYSDGTKVYVLTSTAILHFSISDEKWNSYPYSGFSFSTQTRYFPSDQALVVVEGNKIFRYLPTKLSWDKFASSSDILDLQITKDPIYFVTDAGAFQYITSTSVLQRFDINDLQHARSVVVQGDSLLLTGDKNIISYSVSSRVSNNSPYPSQMPGVNPVKILDKDGIRLLVYPDAMALYHADAKTWELSKMIAARQGGGFSWDDNGAKMHYGPGYESQLKGNISQVATLQAKLAPADALEDTMYYTPAKFGKGLYSDLTLHTTLGKDRYTDIFFRKSTGKLPEKGLLYRGAADDRIESARLGTNTFTTQLSQTLPSVQYEGGSAIVHSESGLKNRDRKIVRAQAGGGLLTAQTVYKQLHYRIEGVYQLTDTIQGKRGIIIPGTFKLSVDGESFDSSNYAFVASTGNLTVTRRDLIDPTSQIIASYKVETRPDSGLEAVEIIPKNNLGEMEFASGTLSPVDWVSLQAGYTGLKHDSLSQRRNIANVMLPFEFRKDKSEFLLKLTPELSYETGQKAKAGALGVQSRLGNWLLGKSTSLLLNYSNIDSAFSSTDTLSSGFGKMRDDLDFTVNHDILTELPLKYTQLDRTSAYGTEHHKLASIGAHFQNLPFLDITWSRNELSMDNTSARLNNTAKDTVLLDRDKTKLKFDLYDLSSPYMQSLLHLNKFTYEIAYTRFTSNKEYPEIAQPIANGALLPGQGDIYYGSLTLCPISSMTITGQATYKKNKQDSIFTTIDTTGGVTKTSFDQKTMNIVELIPNLTLQTIDAPKGIDISGNYSVVYSGASHDSLSSLEQMNNGALSMQRQFLIIAKPGTWTKYLSWMSPRFGLTQSLSLPYDSTHEVPHLSSLLFDPGISGRVTQTYGLYLYPTTEITFYHEDNYTTSDSSINLRVFNDLKWWLSANKLWQTRWQLNQNKDNPSAHLFPKSITDNTIFSCYDVTWNSWLRSNEQIYAVYSIIDSLPMVWDTSDGGRGMQFLWTTPIEHTTKLEIGPDVSASISLQNRGLIKLFLDMNQLSVRWENQNGIFEPGVRISYFNYLQIVFKPNISFDMSHTISFKQGKLNSYSGNLQCKLLF
jgi:hypothetical protein